MQDLFGKVADVHNQKAFTSTQILEAIRPCQERYTSNPAQRFLARLDPIVSHVRSFAGAINAVASANPVGAGIVWGGIYLVLIVRDHLSNRIQSYLQAFPRLLVKHNGLWKEYSTFYQH